MQPKVILVILSPAAKLLGLLSQRSCWLPSSALVLAEQRVPELGQRCSAGGQEKPSRAWAVVGVRGFLCPSCVRAVGPCGDTLELTPWMRLVPGFCTQVPSGSGLTFTQSAQFLVLLFLASFPGLFPNFPLSFSWSCVLGQGQGGSFLLGQRKRRKWAASALLPLPLPGFRPAPGAGQGGSKEGPQWEDAGGLALHSRPSQGGEMSFSCLAPSASPTGQGEKPLSGSPGGILVDKYGHLA